MGEHVYKLQPDRTLFVGGVGGPGAVGVIYEASATGFKAAGNFRDNADYCFICLDDVDDGLGHPRYLYYLPDYSLEALVLEYDVRLSNCQPIDSPLYEWLYWNSLVVDAKDGSRRTVPLFKNARAVSGAFSPATATVTINSTGAVKWKKLILWYQNLPIIFTATQGGETASQIAEALADQVNAVDWRLMGCPFGLLAHATGAQITLTAARYGTVTVTGRDVALSDASWFTGLAAGDQIRLGGTLGQVVDVIDHSHLTVDFEAGDGTHLYVAPRGGNDGNLLTVYTTSTDLSMSATPVAEFAGGSSDVTWHVKIDFDVEGITEARQVFLSLCAKRPNRTAYQQQEWSAEFSNWQVTDRLGKRELKCPGPGSVWIEDFDRWCTYSGFWQQDYPDFGGMSQGSARWTGIAGAAVTIETHCQHQHDIYVGTWVGATAGILEATLDGAAPVQVDLYQAWPWTANVSRLLWKDVPAGQHTVRIANTGQRNPASGGYALYFDYLHCVAPAEFPTGQIQPGNLTYAATDYDTPHTVSITPQRFLWMTERLGFKGDLDHYLGINYWHQRKRVGGCFPTWRCRLSPIGAWTPGEIITMEFGGGATPVIISRTIQQGDTTAVVNAQFVYTINASLTAVWAEYVGGWIVVRPLSPGWNFEATVEVTGTHILAETEGSLKFINTPMEIELAECDPGRPDPSRPGIIRVTTTGPHPYHDDDVVTVSGNALIATGQQANADNFWVLTGCTETMFKLVGSVAPAYAYEAGGQVELHIDGKWEIDDTVQPVLNAATRAWHADLFKELVALGRTCCPSFSMEFTNSPDNPDAGRVWISRYYDGRRVKTGWSSHHCCFTDAVRIYQGKAMQEMAALMVDAGLEPWIQFGEHLWWPQGNYAETAYEREDGKYFSPAGGMAFYDEETRAKALIALGRELARFKYPTDDPAAHQEDADFLRAILDNHAKQIIAYVRGVAKTAGSKFEVLWQLDTHQDPAVIPGSHGGPLNMHINCPESFKAKTPAGIFDRFKMEALNYGAYAHNLDAVRRAIRWAYTEPGWSWDRADVAYLIPNWNAGCPYWKELLLAIDEGLPLIGFWAFDHFCNSTWPLPMPERAPGQALLF